MGSRSSRAAQSTSAVYDGTTFWGPSIGGGVDVDIAGKRPAR